mgnify:FL=1
MNKTLLIMIPIVILYLLYLFFCFLDIKKNEVKHFSKIIWFIICAISVPVGGILYFVFGRKEGHDYDEEIDRNV